MGEDLLGLAFAAGLVAALNPCGFALLPGYLALAVRPDDARGALGALGRAVLATVAMTAGFVVVFGAFATLTVTAADTVQRHLPYLTVLIGLSLMCLGGWLAAGRHVGVPIRGGWAPTTRLGSMFGYGMGYALASLSCTVGPFLAVTAAGLHSGSPMRAASVFAAYAAGFMLVVAALAVAAALASSVVVNHARRIIPYVNRIGGVLLIVIGAYVSYYGAYEIRLFSGAGSPTDPVIASAGRVQGTLAGWVHGHGAWPWLVLLVVVVSVAVVVRYAGSRRRSDPATVDDAPSPASPESPRQAQ